MLLPELEAYQARLEERARGWPESREEDLFADLAQCDAQVRLLERSASELAEALERMPAGGDGSRARFEHRLRVLEQTRDLTGAYARVLQGYLQGRGSA